MITPLTSEQLDDIEARAAAATHCPEASANGRQDGEHTWTGSSFTHTQCELCRFTRPRGERAEETALLVTEVRRLRAELATANARLNATARLAGRQDNTIRRLSTPTTPA